MQEQVMREINRRIFNRTFQVIGAVFLGGAMLALALPLAAIVLGLAALLGPIGGIVGSGVAGLVGVRWLDAVTLQISNRGLKSRLVRKLETIGDLPFNPQDWNVRFVGLAHPVRIRLARLETDDDVGFLQVTPQGICYRGDVLTFDVPMEDVLEVRLRPLGYGYGMFGMRCIEIRFRNEEPFRSLLLVSREGERLSEANRDTIALYHRLRAYLPLQPEVSERRPVRERLTEPVEREEEVTERVSE